MKVGEYVKVVDSKGISPKEVSDIVKVTERHVSGTDIKFEGNKYFWNIDRFEPLPILTEAPPKGSKVVKVEESGCCHLSSDRSLGRVLTTTEEGYHTLHFNKAETGGFATSNLTKGKWALVSLPETEETPTIEPRFEAGKSYKCLEWDLSLIHISEPTRPY